MKTRDFNTGDTCTVIAQAVSGYHFVNWTDANSGDIVSTNARYSFTVTESLDLVANFEQDTTPTYTVSVAADPAAGGTASGGGTFQRGESCTVTASANEGYHFVKWTKGSATASTNATYTFTVTANVTLKAHFAEDITTYEIGTRSDPQGGGNTSGGGVYNSGASCTLTATANNGYAFVRWEDAETHSLVSSSSTYTFTVEEDRTFVAVFEQTTPSYTVRTETAFAVTSDNIQLDGGLTPGSITGLTNGGVYEQGTQCSLTAVPNTSEGFAFNGWSTVPVLPNDMSQTTLQFNVTSNIVCTATFRPEHNLNLTANGSGRVSGTYLGSGRYTLQADPESGHTFNGWYDTSAHSESPGFLNENPTWTFDITQLPQRPPESIEARFT